MYELETPAALERPEYRAFATNNDERGRRLHNNWLKLVRNIYTEISTPYSPTEPGSDRPTFDPRSHALLFAMMGMAPDEEAEFNDWSDHDHVPKRLACPGFISCRRFTAVVGEPKYLTIYEMTSPDALENPGVQSTRGEQQRAVEADPLDVDRVRSERVLGDPHAVLAHDTERGRRSRLNRRDSPRHAT